MTQSHFINMQGEVRGRSVLVLIDSGVSHNIISSNLVWLHGLQVGTAPFYNVRLGDGQRKQTQGCSRMQKCSWKNTGSRKLFFCLS